MRTHIAGLWGQELRWVGQTNAPLYIFNPIWIGFLGCVSGELPDLTPDQTFELRSLPEKETTWQSPWVAHQFIQYGPLDSLMSKQSKKDATPCRAVEGWWARRIQGARKSGSFTKSVTLYSCRWAISWSWSVETIEILRFETFSRTRNSQRSVQTRGSGLFRNSRA